MDFLDTLLQLRLGFVYLNNIEKSLQCATKLIENRGCFSLIDVYIYIWKGVVKISVSSPCFRVIHTEECRRARGACEDVKNLLVKSRRWVVQPKVSINWNQGEKIFLLSIF